MKEFNLEEALAGKPVQTRDGREVTQLTKFETGRAWCLIGILEGDFRSYDINGKYSRDSIHDKDLFMAPEKKSVWVNVYESKDNTDEFQVYTSRLHPTKESALAHRKDYNYIKTIEITNEP